MELLLRKQRFKWYVIAAASQEIAPTGARLNILHSIKLEVNVDAYYMQRSGSGYSEFRE